MDKKGDGCICSSSITEYERGGNLKAIKKMSPTTVTVMMTGYSVEELVKEVINEGT